MARLSEWHYVLSRRLDVEPEVIRHGDCDRPGIEKELHMPRASVLFLAVSTAVLGLAAAQGASAAQGDIPGFNDMDKNDDGKLSRSEASANPRLAEHFKEVDRNGDGYLGRGEYLGVMARRDLFFLRENVAETLDPESKPPLAQQGSGEQASAGASGSGEQASAGASGGDVPGFNEMDKDGDGNLTQSEAGGNPRLAENFQKVDSDGDGQLSRKEYLAVMGRSDLRSLRENLAEFINPEGKPPLATGGKAGKASAGASGAAQDASAPTPVSRQLVRSVQENLKAEGIDAGPIDGIWGPRTSAGVREFQQKQDLDASGQLNAQTLGALGVDGESSSGASARTAK
jgi:Ca2+-binding EF-hand superfamily protein